MLAMSMVNRLTKTGLLFSFFGLRLSIQLFEMVLNGFVVKNIQSRLVWLWSEI